MRAIEAYKTFDGLIFEEEESAMAHVDDKLGEEVDGLLKLFNLDLTRTQEYKSLLQLIKRKKELKKQVDLILVILDSLED